MTLPSLRGLAQRTAVVLFCGLFTGSLVMPAPAQGNHLVRDQIDNLNQQIAADVDTAFAQGLLQERAHLLSALIESDPAAAAESALASDLRQTLVKRHPQTEPLLEERGSWTGPLVIAVTDNFTHHQSKTIQTLRVEGRLYHLHSNLPASSTCARSATVRGIRLGDRMAAASVEVAQDAGSPCSTTGDQKTAVLMINFPSTQITPGYTIDFVHSTFFGPAPSLTDYWNNASYGTTTASGDVFGPFNLDQDFTCNQQDAILQAAIAAADSTVDFTAYQRIFLILPLTTGCGDIVGVAEIGCSRQLSPTKGPFTASVAWLITPSLGPNTYGLLGEFAQTVIHEGGHNLGLAHASSMDYDTLAIGAVDAIGVHGEYGDPFSSMAVDPGHYAAPHKSMLGWLSEGAGYQTVQSAGTWTIAPLSAQSGSVHALRVQRGTGTDQWLWIEYRQPIGPYEPTVLINEAPRDFNGVLVHLEDPTLTNEWPAYTHLLTFQPLRLPNDFNQALFGANTTWTDPYTNLTLSVGIATPTGIPVTVSYDNGCATLTATSQSFSPAAESGQVNIQAPATCFWNAAVGGEWIVLTGATSGTGSGVIPYSVVPNSSTVARSSFISVSHQTFTVSQAAQPQGGSVTVAPSGGTSSSQALFFQFSDATSWKNLVFGEININQTQVTANSCYIHWDANANQLSLRDNGDDSWVGPVAVGSAGTLANGQCVLHPETAVLTGSGPTATLSLQIDFTNRFRNNGDSLYMIYMQSQSQAAACGWQQAGTWNISFAFQPVSVSPASGIGNQQVFTFTVDGFYPYTDYYEGDQVTYAFTTSSAFGTVQFFDHGCALTYFGGNNIALDPDLASAPTGNVPINGTLGSGPPISNSQCTLDLANSSAALSGSTLTLNLSLSFKPAFAGEQNIYVFGAGTGWPLGASYAPLGMYTVTSGNLRRPIKR
jgi:hypothetical protein